jgi:hypothetical protein
MRFCTCAVNILLKEKHQALLVFFHGYLNVSKSVASVLLFAVLSPWFSVLLFVPIMSEVARKVLEQD